MLISYLFQPQTRRNTVDTKTLYDLARDADIGFQHDDGYQDAKKVWIDGYMKSPELLDDLWVDALCESRQTIVSSLLKSISNTHESIERSQDSAFSSVGMTLAYASSTSQCCNFIGGDIYKSILEYVEKYVTSECEIWWADCQGYHTDMMEARGDDNAYAQYRDRQMSGELA